MKKALFKTGDKVKYLGTRQVESSEYGKPLKPLIFPGMVVTIIDTKPPQKGLGKVTYKGEPIDDQDDDGYNIYQNEYGNMAIIWPDKKNEWVKI